MKKGSFMQRVADAWLNLSTGMGGPQDKGVDVTFCLSEFLSPDLLTDLYTGNWLTRAIVESVPNLALARSFQIQGDPSSDLLKRFDDLNYAQHDDGALQRSIYFGRLYGGAGLFLGYGSSGDPSTPVEPEQGDVQFFDVFTRHELVVPSPSEVGIEAGDGIDGQARESDPNSPLFGKPTHFKVVGHNPRRGLIFHTSRLIKMQGANRPPQGQSFRKIGSRAIRRDFDDPRDDWSDSILQSRWEDLQRYGSTWQAIQHLIQVASVGVMKIDGLMQMLAQQNSAAVRARIDILNSTLSTNRLLLLDASTDEDYERKAVSFADLPQLIAELQIATAGAFGIPASILFGRAPAGMNSTGASDLKNWYDTGTEWRTRVLKPRMDRLLSSIAGKEIEVQFLPVNEPTEKEAAELRGLQIAGDEKLWKMEIFTPQELRDAARAGQRVEDLESLPDKIPESEKADVPPALAANAALAQMGEGPPEGDEPAAEEGGESAGQPPGQPPEPTPEAS